MKKIIPLSLLVNSILFASNITLLPVDVESTLLEDVSQNAQISADLAEALSDNIPSVFMNRRSAIANDVFIRGQKRDNISIDVDGTKVYGACPNRMDPPISHILASQIDSVEVIEGPYDVENFGTLSGGLRVKTKTPTKQFNGELSLSYGSWDYKKVGVKASGGNDFIKMMISASYQNSGQYKDGNGDTLADQIDNYVQWCVLLGKIG